MFQVLLNYLRTGHVSIPAHIDGPHIRNELVFWGLNPGLEVTFSGESSWVLSYFINTCTFIEAKFLLCYKLYVLYVYCRYILATIKQMVLILSNILCR